MHTPPIPPAHQRMHALLQARHATPFCWGSADCALWAADALQALHGIDLAANLRGRYTTALQALRLVQPLGGLRGLLAAHLQPAVCPVDGDVAITQPSTQRRMGALAVWWRGHLIGQGQAGLVLVAPAAVRSWWHLRGGAQA